MEYTLLEASRLLGITKNQAKYRLKSVPKTEIRHAEDGRIYISAAGLEYLRPKCDASTDKPVLNQVNHHSPGENQLSTAAKTSSMGAKSVYKPPETGSATEKPVGETTNKPPAQDQTAGVIAALQAAVDLLGDQLAEKDRQIQAKDRQIQEAQAQAAELGKQIATITQALQAAQEQAQAAQALHAGTIQKQLIDSAGSHNSTAEGSDPLQNDTETRSRKWWQWWK